MAKREVTVIVCVCERCGHEWIPRGKFEPKICPGCKSIYWDRPRRVTFLDGDRASTPPDGARPGVSGEGE